MNAPSRADLAWCAGLFEGEGCFTIQRPKGHVPHPSAQLVMTDFDIVARFHSILGAGTVHFPTVRPDRKPAMRWQIQRFEDFQALVAMFWPWLGRRRRARAKEVLAVVAAVKRRRMCPHFEPPRYANSACKICARLRGMEKYWREHPRASHSQPQKAAVRLSAAASE